MKTFQEIRAELNQIFSKPLNMQLYLGFGNSESREYRLADFDDGSTAEVSAQFIAGIKRFFEAADITTRALSNIDQRAGALYHYDIADRPTEFETVIEIAGGKEPALFSFADFDFTTLRTIMIKVSTTNEAVVFLKQFYPVSLVKRDQTMLVLKDDKRFTTIDKDIIRITNGFEVMLLGGGFYINDYAKLEKAFGFDEIAESQKQAIVDAVLGLEYIADANGHLAALAVPKRDILRAKNSPVFSLPKATVLAFVESKSKKLGLKVLNGKIQLTSRASVSRFIKLLNDDYLTSELTKIEYETAAKDQLSANAD